MRNSLKLDGQVKTYLKEDELPKAWYNVRADMKKKPAPLLNSLVDSCLSLSRVPGGL